MNGLSRGAAVVGISTLLALVMSGVAGAEPVGLFGCRVPAEGAQRCASFEVPGKQTVKILLTSSDGHEVGFCLDSEANGAELGDCRAVNEGERSAVLWTNPDPGRVSVGVRANVADRYFEETDIEFIVDVG